jgi:carboxyl-terminal processing protease
MHRFLVLLLVVLLPGCGGSNDAETPEASPTAEIDPVAYLRIALDFIQENALFSHDIDWPAMREEAFRRAEGATTSADTYRAISYVLSEAGGIHSRLVEQDLIASMTQDNPEALLPEGRRIGDVGYLLLPPANFGEDYPQRYADTALEIIREIDGQPACGWVIDLRDNTGGNMWPMLAAVEPLLGEREVGAFVDEADGIRQAWILREGQSIRGEDVVTSATDYDLQQENPPVAIITGRMTASSGEAVIVAFRGREDTRSFGEPTRGVPTANVSEIMPDGAALAVTVALMADRTGQTYDGAIEPDQPVDRTRVRHPPEDDNALQASLTWLADTYGCAKA